MKKPYGQTVTDKNFNPFGEKNDLIKIGVDEEYSRTKIKKKLLAAQKMLESKIPEFSTFERPAQQALLDMEYNVGDRKFRPYYKDDKTGEMKAAWPKLFDAVGKRDWKAASEESRSGDVQTKRNEWRRSKFIEADLLRKGQ